MDWLRNKGLDPLLASTSHQERFVDLVSPNAELHDPTPDLHNMFQLYNFQFFNGKLDQCVVEWSQQMTGCAGTCQFHSASGMCTIRMSESLLKLRSRRDLIETLLHEMIHACLFVTERNIDRDSHGPNFQAHMHRINRLTGTNITIYHNFHAEAKIQVNWFHNKGLDPLLTSTSRQEQFVDLVNPDAELQDPTPDLHTMFQLYNMQFFSGKLGQCVVEWSKRMKRSAGLCYYQPASGMCIIRVSEPLLKLRPRRDFVETLLHEMIHAYLFVTERNTDRDGHGPNFQAHMHRINRLAGTRITIYHNFYAEVAAYKTQARVRKMLKQHANR